MLARLSGGVHAARVAIVTDPSQVDVRVILTPPRNPLRMLVSPLGWRAVLYRGPESLERALADWG